MCAGAKSVGGGAKSEGACVDEHCRS